VWVRAESPRRGTASPELHPCAIAESLTDTSAYVCLRVPAPRAPRSSLRKPFHNAPPAPHPHTHACTLSSCSATSPGARPLHASPVCRSRLRKSSLRAPALALQRAACRPLPHTPPRRASTCILCCSTPAEPLTHAPPTASPAPFAHHCSLRAARIQRIRAATARYHTDSLLLARSHAASLAPAPLGSRATHAFAPRRQFTSACTHVPTSAVRPRASTSRPRPALAPLCLGLAHA
jgi:hypothetical protein